MTTHATNPVTLGRRSLDVFFTQSVKNHPERPALVVHGKSWSYRALDREVRSLERVLAEAGVAGKRANIGVLYAKGMLSYAAALAIMRTDNVYVPLNPALPTERLLRIIKDAGIGTMIIDTDAALEAGVVGALQHATSLKLLASKGNPSASLNEVLRTSPQHEVWWTSTASDRAGDEDDTSVHAPGVPDPTAIAYIIFTSGSTGVPKGVPITHESACRCIEKCHELFGTHEQDRFSEFSALSFDVSIADLFLCWKSGAALHVPEASEALVPLKFAVSHEITVWSSVPSLSNFLLKLRLLKSNALPKLRLSLFCGEALPTELAQAWMTAAPSGRIFNIYGPTESTIFATYYEYLEQRGATQAVVPIGLPLPGVSCLVVDEGRVVEGDGVPGELWLSGDQLTPGYWNNPTATQQAFVRFPVGAVDGQTWYRTGDLVSYQRGQGLLFRGRLDRQVKLRGYRVELQEIESVLREVVGCTLVAVIPIRNTGGICEQLVAYCDKLTADELILKERCGSRIPRYMVPDRILELDTFPVGTSGKIDYLALAARASVPSGQVIRS